ncbi:Hypothetical predicted protein [Podarcis lilfordi]|uniref:HTH CENPB-type domain-containing protein n=1 Tax=Podarcis lilfordi TaxID=74358 RepID=A0AA35KBH7_9SAUR|nr:Hypothetical predicted protein [Podarcis lilfordi]
MAAPYARKLSSCLQPANEFHASSSWLVHFKRSFSLKNIGTSDEAAYVDQEAAQGYPHQLKRQKCQLPITMFPLQDTISPTISSK